MIEIKGYQILSKDSVSQSALYESNDTVIYRGLRKEDGKPVIIKMLKHEYPLPEQIARFKREYEMTHTLNSTKVIQVYSFEKYKNAYAMIMEDFGGESLAKQSIATTEDELVNLNIFFNIAIQVLEALGEIHQKNIIHKDINPSNIVWNSDKKEAKIIDFGISTILSREKASISNPDELEGTLAYMSPEQTGRMNRTMDYRTDFYSLGVTFYELLTGKLPFSTNDSMEMVHWHIAKTALAPHKVNNKIPEMISRIIMKLIAKTAEERYQSSFGLMMDLKSCQKQFALNNEIEEFELGQHDISDHFQIPQKLYGREDEIEVLLSAFNKVSKGAAEMMLVAGYSGVGKSSIIEEIQKPIVERRGYFISGKFDQYQKNIPYASVIQAFHELIEYLLTESDEKILDWKNKLLTALEDLGQIIIDVIPEIEYIIGPQIKPIELSGNEAENRFKAVFEKFLGVFCSKDHPLVLFLDDLQWADLASLNLIQTLLTGEKKHHLLIIGAYRDNEVSQSHPLTLIIEEIEKKKSIQRIKLQALNMEHTNELIADTLYSSTEETNALAELVYHKTGGNPFFLNKLLHTMYEEQLLNFNLEEGNWTWELESIKSMGVSENVVDLMVSKINKLKNETRELLVLASCLGNQFNIDILSKISNMDSQKVAVNLFDAIQEELIIALGENYQYFANFDEEESKVESKKIAYKFIHDRIHEAAYSLMSENERKKIHLKVGKNLLESTDENNLHDKIFDIVNNLNLSEELITDQTQRDELAGLNLIAAKKAKASTAYTAALSDVIQGIVLLGENGWDRCYDTMFSLYRERIECEFLCGKIDKSEKLFEIAIQNAKTKHETGELYQLMMRIYLTDNNYLEGVKLGKKGLLLFGINIPDDPTEYQAEVEKELKAIKDYTSELGVLDLVNAPEMTDKDMIICTGIFHELIVCFVMLSHEQLFLTVLILINLSFKYGQSAITAVGYIFYSITLSFQQDYDNAYFYGDLAMKLKEKYLNPLYAPKVHNTFCNFVNHYKNHIETNVPIYEDSYKYCLQSGETWWGAWAVSFIRTAKLVKGDSLEDVYKTAKKYSDYIISSKFEPLVQVMHAQTYKISNLMDMTGTKTSLSSGEFDEDKMITSLEQMPFDVGLFWHYTYKSMLLYLYGEKELALEITMKSDKIKDNVVPGLMMYPDHFFFNTLIIADNYETFADQDKEQYLELMKKSIAQMELWTTHSAENFKHRYLLMSAELARITGDDLEAMDLYEQAIEYAQKNKFLNHEAISNELAAKFYLRKNRKNAAKGYLHEARYCYLKWGAKRKLIYFDKEYGELLAENAYTGNSASFTDDLSLTTVKTRTGTSAVFDLGSVIKASQAISGEIVLERFLEKLIKLMIENAGAQKGFLLLNHNGQLRIEAEAEIEKDEVTLIQTELTNSDETEISKSIIHFVERTKEALVLDDASSDERFNEDVYISTYNIKSVLCAPILHQGKLTGIIYLENNLVTGAFTPERLEILNLLSSQTAISLENARLYSNLELKVEERTEKLNQMLQYMENANKKIMDSIKYAQLIQSAILPKKDEIHSNFPESFIIWEPRDLVGGDFYQFYPTTQGKLLILGDCTGHGVPGGFMTMLSVSALRRIIFANNCFDPAEILSQLNKIIKTSLNQTYKRTDANVGLDGGICLINEETSTLTFAGARISLVIIKDGELTEIKGDRKSIGYRISKRSSFNSTFTNNSISLEKGMSFYIFTDGFIDQFGEESQRSFGKTRLFDLLLQNHHMSFSEQKEIILEEFKNYQGANDRLDDVTIMGFRV